VGALGRPAVYRQQCERLLAGVWCIRTAAQLDEDRRVHLAVRMNGADPMNVMVKSQGELFTRGT